VPPCPSVSACWTIWSRDTLPIPFDFERSNSAFSSSTNFFFHLEVAGSPVRRSSKLYRLKVNYFWKTVSPFPFRKFIVMTVICYDQRPFFPRHSAPRSPADDPPSRTHRTARPVGVFFFFLSLCPSHTFLATMTVMPNASWPFDAPCPLSQPMDPFRLYGVHCFMPN